MILVIDNYDSFVFNVARYFEGAGAKTHVVRNDAVSLDAIAAMKPDAIVLSPGPCAPKQAGISLDVVSRFSGRLPILGICLGHQCIGEAFGGRTVHARTAMHGRASAIEHDGTGLFGGLPSPFNAGRYHSLIVDLDEDAPLAVTARSPDGEIMGLAHRSHPTFGLQFHPESILTEHGDALVRAFLGRLS
jgi:para-aminobenzoate synthetase component II